MVTMTIPYALLAIGLASSAYADDTPAPTGNFLSSLKQSFSEDYDREVVRGHFDIGTPPSPHRYYCLVDPKTGKIEEMGIAGTPTRRRDGMIRIEGASVSFYSCADAEAKGQLVTSDYHVTMATGAKARVAPASASGPAPAPAPAVSGDNSLKLNTTDPMATLQSFIEVYNSGDSAGLTSLLTDSTDFAWVQPDGRTVWGRQGAAEALQASRSAGALLQLQTEDGHTISLASKTTILITKLRLTQTSQEPRIIRCSGVIVQTPKGWRIASLFMTPELM
jgi:hypothetical protein